uniref:Uncharacterized protein n=1 Tax=Anguilla anguilla TaxID=7936 RepID=A0A0E9UZB7_ANGAN
MRLALWNGRCGK